MQTVVFETKPYDREPISAPLVSARWRDGCIERDLIANDVHNRCRKRGRLRDIAQQFQNWLKNRCQKWGVPVLDAPEGRRDDSVDPYFNFKRAKTDEVVVVLKAREPAPIMLAIGSEDRWHLQLARALDRAVQLLH